MRALITTFKMRTSNVKWCIQARKTLVPDTFKNYTLATFSMFPESQAKLLANSYIYELGRKYSRKDHGFTCSSLNTAQCIWTSALAENRDVIILLTVITIQTQNKSVKLSAYSLTIHQSTALLSLSLY